MTLSQLARGLEYCDKNSQTVLQRVLAIYEFNQLILKQFQSSGIQSNHMSQEENSKTENNKKTASYTYWVDENNKSRQLPEEHRPKKLYQPVETSEAPAEGPSKWNKLGSWEEKTIPNSELQQVITIAISEWLVATKSILVLKSVVFNGEFKRVYSNNKRRILYEISGSVKFESDQDCEIKLEDISCTGDRDYSIKAKKKEDKEALAVIGGDIVDIIVKEFSKYKD